MSAKRRYNGRRIFANILWSLLGLATVVLLGAAMSLRSHRHCKGVSINISGARDNFFINKTEINNILEKLCGGSLPGKSISSFNLALIENTLKKDQWIKNAELFFDNNAVLRVDVVEREPVARIFTKTGSSFYLDSSLAVLPLSDKTSARVPVFSNFSPHENGLTKSDSVLLNDIKNISSYILNDPFWMAQVDQVDITPEKTFEMIPKIGNQVILFGNADNYREKFDNLLTFYKQVATKVGWNTYSKINVQYKGQVVAVKRGAEDMIQDVLRTKQLMQTIVIAAQQQANDSINNIQLVQHDENIIPVAPQLDDIPDEQPIAEKPKPTIAEPLTTHPSSTEKPIATLTTTVIKEKAVTPEKKNAKPVAKPFWLQAATTTPVKNSKRTVTKPRSASNGKPNPPDSYRDQKKTVILKSAAQKKVTRPVTKPITKPVTKPVIKPVTKQKAKTVMPQNDY